MVMTTTPTFSKVPAQGGWRTEATYLVTLDGRKLGHVSRVKTSGQPAWTAKTWPAPHGSGFIARHLPFTFATRTEATAALVNATTR